VDPLDQLGAVADAAEIRALADAVKRIHVAESIKGYAVDLAEATRRAPEIRLGASPRATLQLLRLSRAWAGLEGRDYVIPDDLQVLSPPVLPHRLLLPSDAHAAGRTAAEVLARLIRTTPIVEAAAQRQAAH